MTDTVTLRSPLLGVIVEPLLLRPYMQRLIRTRNAVLVRKAAAASGGRAADAATLTVHRGFRRRAR